MTDVLIVSPKCVQPRRVLDLEHPTDVAAFVKLARVVTIALVVIAGVLLTPRFTRPPRIQPISSASSAIRGSR